MISILMPVKNAAPFLVECIESILVQSIENWELIAIDDHSTDSSKKILDSYAASDQRIHISSNPSQGIIPALKQAFIMAKGTYITRMDADDRMLHHKLEVLHRAISSNAISSIAVAQVQYFSETALGEGYKKYANWLNELTEHEQHYEQLFKECTIPSISWMSTKTTLKEIGAFEGDSYPEDYEMAFKCCYHKIKIIPTKSIVHEWRDHPMRSSRNDPNYLDNRFLALKLKWFFKIHFQKDRNLVLWGAGKKGKAITTLLQEKLVHFHWISNNVKKHGHIISSVTIEDENALKEIDRPQVIIAVANADEQAQIKEVLVDLEITDFFFFC